MRHFTYGFADELVKVASAATSVRNFLSRIERSKGLREAIRRSALLGGVTGGVSGFLSKRKGESALKKSLKGGMVGALGGAITGGAFPGWFEGSNMLAHDEVKRLRRLR